MLVGFNKSMGLTLVYWNIIQWLTALKLLTDVQGIYLPA